MTSVPSLVARPALQVLGGLRHLLSARAITSPATPQAGEPSAGESTALAQLSASLPLARWVQPDPTTCGSAVLVVARALRDPAYAERLRQAPDPAATFGAEAQAVHR